VAVRADGDVRAIRLREDDLIVYPPGSAHMQESSPGAEEALLKLRLSPPLPAVWRRIWHLRPRMEGYLKSELLHLTAPAPVVDAARQLEYDLRCHALLARLFRETGACPAPGGQADAMQAHARRAYAFMQDNFCAIRGLAQVARHVGISESHLRHVFRASHGIGLKEFLDELRLRHARRLLTRTTLSVKEVATHCGYATARHFCARFRQVEGVAPGAYRRRTSPDIRTDVDRAPLLVRR
jgi:AraC-like DNA-binding protein